MYRLPILLSFLCYQATCVSQEHLTFLKKAQQQFENGQTTDAISTCQKALQYAEINVGRQHVDYGDILHYLGNYLFYNGQKNEGLKQLDEGISIIHKSIGEKNETYMQALADKGVIYITTGDNDRAETIFVRLLEIKKYMDQSKDKDFAILEGNLGLIQQDMGKYKESELHILQSLHLLEQLKLEETPEYASALTNLATLYYQQQQYFIAEPYYKQALKAQKKIESELGENYLNCLQNTGHLYLDLLNFEKAEQIFQRTRFLKEKAYGIQSPQYAAILNDLAVLYNAMGEYRKAEPLYLQALEIKKKYLDEDDPSYVLALYNIGMFSRNVGREKDAIDNIVKAVTLLGNRKEALPVQYAEYLTGLAGVYMDFQKYEQAEKCLKEALGLYQKMFKESGENYLFILQNLGRLYDGKGDAASAEKYYLRAYAINEESKEKHPLLTENVLSSIGGFYQRQNKLKEAEKYIREAVSLSKKHHGPGSEEYLRNAGNLAVIYSDQGKDKQAEALFTEVLDKYIHILENNFAFMTEAEKASYYGTIGQTIQSFYTFALSANHHTPEIAGKVYNYRLATKGLLYQSSNKIKKAILFSKDSLLMDTYASWKSQKNYLAKVYALTPDELKAKGINLDSLQKATDRMEKDLSLRSEAFAKSKSARHATWKDVYDKLKPDEAAVEIIRMEQFFEDTSAPEVNYYALSISKEDKYPMMFHINGSKEFESKNIRDYREAIKNSAYDTSSYIFWKKIELVLGLDADKIKKVYLSGDGVYNQVSIAGLKDAYMNQYITDKSYEIHLVSNTKDILNYGEESRKINENTTAALFGFPDYNYDVTQLVASAENTNMTRGIRDSKFYLPELPGTKTETEGIARLLHQKRIETSLYTGKDAVEQKVKALKKPTVLHIATHGFFEEDQKMNNDSRSTGVDKQATNPLLRSGLMMAGASNAYSLDYKDEVAFSEFEDGVLTAYEAMNLDLDGTELVALSACQTGLGEIKNGEGVYGLQRAFQIAGAKSLIMSLWPVNDEATQQLMTMFYQKWLESGDKHRAFKEAQLELKKKFPYPYYWSAFVLVGE